MNLSIGETSYTPVQHGTFQVRNLKKHKKTHPFRCPAPCSHAHRKHMEASAPRLPSVWYQGMTIDVYIIIYIYTMYILSICQQHSKTQANCCTILPSKAIWNHIRVLDRMCLPFKASASNLIVQSFPALASQYCDNANRHNQDQMEFMCTAWMVSTCWSICHVPFSTALAFCFVSIPSFLVWPVWSKSASTGMRKRASLSGGTAGRPVNISINLRISGWVNDRYDPYYVFKGRLLHHAISTGFKIKESLPRRQTNKAPIPKWASFHPSPASHEHHSHHQHKHVVFRLGKPTEDQRNHQAKLCAMAWAMATTVSGIFPRRAANKHAKITSWNGLVCFLVSIIV